MIHLSPDQRHAICQQAEQAYPNECCGLLAGITNGDGSITVTRVRPSPNTLIGQGGGDARRGGQDRFEVDPQVRFDLMRALNDTSESIIGHYHSHPDHPAEPSQHDLDMAFEPDLTWLIASVSNGRATDIRAWRLNRDSREILSVPLETSENS